VAWIWLLCAAVLEIAWAVGLKYTQGFTRLWPSVFTIVTSLGSFWFLALAARHLPIGTAYAIWTGIGAVGTALFGMYLFHESREWARFACIALIVTGVVGLKLLTPSPQP